MLKIKLKKHNVLQFCLKQRKRCENTWNHELRTMPLSENAIIESQDPYFTYQDYHFLERRFLQEHKDTAALHD